MTTIYTRNKEGDLIPLNIPAIKGKDGINGVDGVTPNIEVGEVVTLEAGEKATVTIDGTPESPVLNFSIPKGKDGDGSRNSCDIDDNEISEENTWSSDKITTWSMEQDGVHWVEKEDNFISVDNTYEYKLKEIEIFGDTWQDSDSKNLFDGIISGYEKTSDGRYKVNSCCLFSEPRDIQLKPDTQYTIGIVESTSLKNTWVLVYVGDTKYESGNKSSFTFTTDSTGLIKLRGGSPGYVFEEAHVKDFQLNEGSVLLEYDEYHKADLSNIHHAGELYLGENGEPKLDEQDRKQYKFEIGSENTILSNWNEYNLLPGRFWNGSLQQDGYIKNIEKNAKGFTFEIINSTIRGVVIQGIKGVGRGKYTLEFDLNKYGGTLNGSMFANINTFKNGVFVEQANGNSTTIVNGTKHTLEFNLVENFDSMWLCIGVYQPYHYGKHGVENINFYKGEYCKTGVLKSCKQTIILPCQLSRIGNVKDRLFWDVDNGRYMIEKNVVSYTIPSDTIWIVKPPMVSNTGYNRYRTKNDLPFSFGNIKAAIHDKYPVNINGASWSIVNRNEVQPISGKKEYYVQLSCKTPQEVADLMNGTTLYFHLETPELIETNITEPLYLPTYNNKTHAYITNTNNAKATIKAKFPLKTSNTLSTLSFESNKASNDILNLQDINVELVSNNFEIDFRVSEIEWNLEDRGLLTLHELLTNENISNNKINLTRYEQAKILIISNKYNKDKMTYQLSKYLERKYIKQEEFNELIELMK